MPPGSQNFNLCDNNQSVVVHLNWTYFSRTLDFWDPSFYHPCCAAGLNAKKMFNFSGELKTLGNFFWYIRSLCSIGSSVGWMHSNESGWHFKVNTYHGMADVPWESQDIGKRKLSAYSESYRKVLSSPEKLNIFFALRRQPHNNKDDKMRDPKTRLYRIINRNMNISL